MLRILPEGYTVKYRYERPLVSRPAQRTDEVEQTYFSPRGGLTEARIFDEHGNLVATGSAVCSPKDQFNKRIGRMIALGRALQKVEAQI